MTANPVRNLSELIPLTVASGQAVSDSVNMIGRIAVGVYVPTGWVSGDLTFEVSSDGEDYFTLVTAGAAFSQPAAAGQYIAFQPELFFGARHLRIVSSTAQNAERILNVASANPAL